MLFTLPAVSKALTSCDLAITSLKYGSYMFLYLKPKLSQYTCIAGISVTVHVGMRVQLYVFMFCLCGLVVVRYSVVSYKFMVMEMMSYDSRFPHTQLKIVSSHRSEDSML